MTKRMKRGAKRTHGMTYTPTYGSWRAMKERCTNPNNQAFKNYGGRGVTVCERWLKFENFLEDMGERPLGKTLDRWPNINGNYEPGNCRWATKSEQQRNTTTTVFLTFNGETLAMVEWATRYGIMLNTLSYRIKSGCPIQDALLITPRFGLKRVPQQRRSDGTYETSTKIDGAS